jgi:hypothetical protein
MEDIPPDVLNPDDQNLENNQPGSLSADGQALPANAGDAIVRPPGNECELVSAFQADQPPGPASPRQIFRDAWRAFLFQEDVYGAYIAGSQHLKRGAGFLVVLLFVIGLGISLGGVIDYLTLPRVDLLQDGLARVFIQSEFYRQMVVAQPDLKLVFQVLFTSIWYFIRTATGYPTRWDILAMPFVFVLNGLFDWITIAFFTQMTARWLGSKTERGTVYAPMALAQAPKLLYLLSIIPGMNAPVGLVRLWVLAASYQAVRATFGLSPGRSVVAVIFPYFLNTFFILLAFILGIALGVLGAQFVL